MDIRISQFKQQFSHVWVSGQPGISLITYRAADKATADELVSRLFYYRLIADV